MAAARGIRPQADVIVTFLDGEERQFVYDPDEGGYAFSGEFLLGAGHLADSLAMSTTNIHGFVNADMIAYNPRVDSPGRDHQHPLALAGRPARGRGRRFQRVWGTTSFSPVWSGD